MVPNPTSNSLHVVFSVQHRGFLEEKQEDLLVGNQFVILSGFIGGTDSYNFDYSAVAVKSRCVTENGNMAFIINIL
jgi:hypothetical protein